MTYRNRRKSKVTGVPNTSWSQNMTANSDFVQNLEKSMIKILFPSPEYCIDQICCIVFLTLLQLKSISTMNLTFDPVPHGYVMWVYYIKINTMQPLFCKIYGFKYICIIVFLNFELEAHFVPQE